MKILKNLSEAIGHLKPGSVVCLHTGCAEPLTLAKAISDHAPILDGVRLLTLMPMGETPYSHERAARHLEVQSFFPGVGLRKAFKAGLVTPLRYSLSEIPGLFERGEERADLLLLQVSTPDHCGYVSLGLAVDYMKAVLRQNPIVIAELNPNMPRTMGDTLVHTSEIDWYIDVDYSPQEAPPATPDETDIRIAVNVAGLIDDGAVLQVGIGSLPDQVLATLGHLKHLGVHSGILTDAIRPLIEEGAVDNSQKDLLPGVSVTTMAAGTRDFYNFLHENRSVEFHPSALTHNAEVLAGINRLTAVNSALQVDMTGAVNAEQIGSRIIALPGGLIDFARGATRSCGGKSIIALRSTFNEGRMTNIVPSLGDLVPSTLKHDDVDYLVTEFGVAPIRGASARDRSQGLIDIAHPDFREELSRYQHDARLN